MRAAAWLGAPDPEAAEAPEVSKAVDLAALGGALAAYALGWVLALQGGPRGPLLRLAAAAALPAWLAARARATPRHRELLAPHLVGSARWAAAHAACVLLGLVARGSVLQAAAALLGALCVYGAAYTFLVAADLRAAVRLLTVQ